MTAVTFLQHEVDNKCHQLRIMKSNFIFRWSNKLCPKKRLYNFLSAYDYLYQTFNSVI